MYIYLRSSNSLHSELAYVLCKNEAIFAEFHSPMWLVLMHAQSHYAQVQWRNASWVISNMVTAINVSSQHQCYHERI